MYAVIETGGKQYKVEKGVKFDVEKLDADVGDKIELPVLLVEQDGKVLTGSELKGAAVTAEVLRQGKDKKIVVFKYKAKKNERKRQGHRQPHTTLLVKDISLK
jgi:large subunit ribosomal protein L21